MMAFYYPNKSGGLERKINISAIPLSEQAPEEPRVRAAAAAGWQRSYVLPDHLVKMLLS